MNIIEALILGIVQGLTEFIPVSSSGHLVVIDNLISGTSSRLFIEFVNFGTLMALLVFFRHKIFQIIKDIIEKKSYKLALNILITAIPAGLIGFLFADFIGSTSFFSSSLTVAVALFVIGIIMINLDRIPLISKRSDIDGLTKTRSLGIGLFQVMSLIPGVSRSGSTIIGGKLLGLNSKDAAEYSFLASIPIMIGVSLKLILKDSTYLYDNLLILTAANIAAFVAGIFAIRFMIDYLSKNSLAIFGWYRVILAILILSIILI